MPTTSPDALKYQAQFVHRPCGTRIPVDQLPADQLPSYEPGTQEGRLQATSHLRNEASREHTGMCTVDQYISMDDLFLVRLIVNAVEQETSVVQEAEAEYRQARDAFNRM